MNHLPPLRPPGAGSEERFLNLCIRCGKCLQVCPHNSLKLLAGFGRGRLTPALSPQDKPCELCMKCGDVCPTGAIPSGLEKDSVKMGKAYILTTGCHNYANGPMCWTCYDRCPLRGQAMKLANGITPSVGDACAGCGVCAYVCPQAAIVIVPAGSDFIPADAAPASPDVTG